MSLIIDLVELAGVDFNFNLLNLNDFLFIFLFCTTTCTTKYVFTLRYLIANIILHDIN
jgi:hypothetical protein